MYNATINRDQSLVWENVVSKLTNELMGEVFQRRLVKSELKPKTTAEILIYLDLLVVDKLNESFPVSTTVKVSKFSLNEVTENVDDSNVLHSDVVRMSSIRQDFYRKGILHFREDEDFLRTVGMQWFQFPFQEIDGSIKPSEFDFSVYFSDNQIVSEILFELAPRYANRIARELKKQYSLMS